jgi:hypothetical protein
MAQQTITANLPLIITEPVKALDDVVIQPGGFITIPNTSITLTFKRLQKST